MAAAIVIGRRTKSATYTTHLRSFSTHWQLLQHSPTFLPHPIHQAANLHRSISPVVLRPTQWAPDLCSIFHSESYLVAFGTVDFLSIRLRTFRLLFSQGVCYNLLGEAMF
jgi:hypothetical protein